MINTFIIEPIQEILVTKFFNKFKKSYFCLISPFPLWFSDDFKGNKR